METRNYLIYLAIVHRGDYDKIYEAIRGKEVLPSEEEMMNTIKTMKCRCITILDEDYPEYLKIKVYRPPFVLFYYGDISLLKDDMKNVAFVGSRSCTAYGKEMTKTLVEGLCPDYNIVSGLAAGIDSSAHFACVNKLGKTIAVLGSGIDVCYPAENRDLYEQIKQKGLIISEYPNDTEPCANHFPIRNRLIVGLSRALVITQAKKHSGTSISAAIALDAGKDVCCVPYPATENSLCNRLLKYGAYLVESVNDLDDILNKSKVEPVFTL